MQATLGAAMALAAITVLPVPPAAHAGEETCRGQTATHVGTPGEQLTTSPGPDVVVTNGASEVRTLNGADVVCVTRTRAAYVVPGGGDDVVDASRFGGDVLTTVLGESGVDGSSGDDTYVGGRTVDRVFVRSGMAADRKVIRTAGGKDVVRVERGYPGDVTAGLGTEGDELRVERPRRGIVVDGEAGPDVVVTPCRGCDAAGFDLESGEITVDGGAAGRAEGFQVLDVVATGDHVVPMVRVRGGEDANHVSVAACRSSLIGRGGNDRLLATGAEVCARHHTEIDAGAGDDLMTGTVGPDELRGGLGHDSADGNGGRDLCRAEIRDECEA